MSVLDKKHKKGGASKSTASEVKSKLVNYFQIESSKTDWYQVKLRKKIKMTNPKTQKTTVVPSNTVVFAKKFKDMGTRFVMMHTVDINQNDAYLSDYHKDIKNIVEFLGKVRSRQMINFLEDTFKDLSTDQSQ